MSDQNEPAHDVLAAEEFGVPAPDPRLREREAHDVLAAEEFGVPAPDPVLRVTMHGGSLALPTDPYDPDGSEPAHDVLAAEEFALPGGAPHAVPPDFEPEPTVWPTSNRPLAIAILAVVAVTLVRLRRRFNRSV